MTYVGLEPTILVFQRAKTFHAFTARQLWWAHPITTKTKYLWETSVEPSRFHGLQFGNHPELLILVQTKDVILWPYCPETMDWNSIHLLKNKAEIIIVWRVLLLNRVNNNYCRVRHTNVSSPSSSYWPRLMHMFKRFPYLHTYTPTTYINIRYVMYS